MIARFRPRPRKHIVEMEVPVTGLGERLHAIVRWHIKNKIDYSCERIHAADGTYIASWLLPDEETATEFAVKFGPDMVVTAV